MIAELQRPTEATTHDDERAGPVRRGRLAMLRSFLAGTGELADASALASLRVGASLRLQRGRAAARVGGGSRVEVRAADGRPLGYLPPGDAELVAALLEAGTAATARVRGLVPAFPRLRVQLEIDLGTGGDGA